MQDIKSIGLLFLVISIFACSSSKEKRIQFENVYAEGEISKDTIFNGLIKFYDTSSNQLLYSSNYANGIVQGARIDYFKNGSIKSKTGFRDGKQSGELLRFDTNGALINRQNFYYDLRYGPSIEYQNNAVIRYHFYSLENKELLYIDYDAINVKKTEQINDTNFFFYHFNNKSTSESDSLETYLFLYLPDPPNLKFEYSLCIINNDYTIVKSLKLFSNLYYWDTALIDYTLLKPGESFAIRLEVDNKFDNDKDTQLTVMFKRV